MPSVSPEFPQYTRAEKIADSVVHAISLMGGAIVIVRFLFQLQSETIDRQTAALVVYGLGLVGMLSASALYNLTPNQARHWKTRFRRLDHAMIFVMIAGSYTPFSISALPPAMGIPLCVAIWAMAGIGIGLRLLYERIYKRISLGLYLGMGWLILPVLPSLAAALPIDVIILLLIGGCVYSLGSLIHARLHMPFQNAVWHLMVSTAATLHLVAISRLPS